MDQSVAIQHQIRHNAEELHNYLRDLQQWKEEISRKEKEISEQIVPEEQDLPPIRGSRGVRRSKISVVSKNKKNKEKSTSKENTTCKSTEKPKRIKSYDYDAWAKYDVDKACEEVDSDEGKKEESSTEDGSDNEDYEVEHLKEQALIEKEKGNEFFNMGKLDQAIECYTRGMLSDPMNPFLPANRALALLKKEMYAAAEQDCDLAIAIDKDYTKAFQRRGLARSALKKFDGAREDFQTVLQLEPGSRQALTELAKLKKLEDADDFGLSDSENEEEPESKPIKSKKVSITEVGSASDVTDPKAGLVLPIDKPAHLRSKKPLKRITIQETDNKTLDKLKNRSADLGSGEPATEILAPPPIDVGTVDKKMTNIETTGEEDGPTDLPPPPQTSFQFQATWKKLRHSKDLLYKYLLQIPENNYYRLFQQSLESDVLSDILQIFHKYYVRDNLEILSPLKALTKVQRFQTLVLFLSADDQKVLQALFEFLKANCDLEEVNAVASQYGQ